MGLAWLFRRRRRSVPEPAADPADELRRKLEESRTDAEEAPPAAEPEPAPETPLEDRRQAVHDRGRAAIETMRSSDTESE